MLIAARRDREGDPSRPHTRAVTGHLGARVPRSSGSSMRSTCPAPTTSCCCAQDPATAPSGLTQRKYVCYRYNRNTSQYSTFNTPTDWFCNAAVHLDNGNLLIVGGTAIDGYPNTNGGNGAAPTETYTYAPASGQVTRLGNVTLSGIRACWKTNRRRLQARRRSTTA